MNSRKIEICVEKENMLVGLGTRPSIIMFQLSFDLLLTFETNVVVVQIPMNLLDPIRITGGATSTDGESSASPLLKRLKNQIAMVGHSRLRYHSDNPPTGWSKRDPSIQNSWDSHVKCLSKCSYEPCTSWR